MNKVWIYGFLALILLGSVMALTDYRSESYKKNAYVGAISLKAYDEGCPKVQVHYGYFVQQIYVRTSRGFECQFPSGNKVKEEQQIKPVVVPEPVPVCEDVETCENVCEWDFGWYKDGRHWKFGWHKDCEEVCTTENVCESE